MKKMTIKEIDKFIKKLQTAEADSYAARYKANAIHYLNQLCQELEYRNKKSMPIREEPCHERNI